MPRHGATSSDRRNSPPVAGGAAARPRLVQSVRRQHSNRLRPLHRGVSQQPKLDADRDRRGALSIGTVSSMASQVPAGALVDAIPNKTRVAAFSVLVFTASALMFAIYPIPLFVYLAEVLHGISSCTLGPAIAAMSLVLAGRFGMGVRLGRNARYAAVGNGVGAALMGACGQYVSERAVFYLTAALTLPALVALLPLRRFVRGRASSSRLAIRTRKSRRRAWHLSGAGGSAAADILRLRDAVHLRERADADADQRNADRERQQSELADRRLHRAAANHRGARLAGGRTCRRTLRAPAGADDRLFDAAAARLCSSPRPPIRSC